MSAVEFDDAYLAWTALTEFKGHAAMREPDRARIPLLVRDKDGFATRWKRHGELASVQNEVDEMEFALPLAIADPLPDATEPRAPDKAVIAVIDHGCAFLNSAFRNKTLDRTRLVALWDQGLCAAKAPWQSPKGFEYGRELTGEVIDLELRRLAGEPGQTEAQIYSQLEYLLDERRLLRETAHGTHVLDAASGRIDAQPQLSSAKPARNDDASDAPLIFVDTPRPTADDSTGASNGAFLLDALRYIRLRAGEMPVVVNISLGAFAGPHDGSSLVERAIDEFIRSDGRMVVTIAAGNAALERWHASGEFPEGERKPLEFSWRTMPEDRTDSFLEIWFDTPDRKGVADLELNVTPPGGGQTVGRGSQRQILDSTGELVGAVFRRNARAGGSGAMFLVAVGPSAGPRLRSPAGAWRITLTNRSAAPVRFDAWVQRDEPAWDISPLAVQSSLEAASPGVTLGGARGGLSNLATGSTTVVVGAARLEDHQLSRYSSLGGRLRNGVPNVRDIDVAAAADESSTAIGLVATGIRSNTFLRMGGTSVAAPVVARQIYNLCVTSGFVSSRDSLWERVREHLAGLADRTDRARGDDLSPTYPLLMPT